MKRRTPDHPKVIEFQRILGVPRYGAVGLLEMLWHFTAEFAPQGDIGKFSDERIAIACGWIDPSTKGRIRGGDQGRSERLISALVAARFLERSTEVATTFDIGSHEGGDRLTRRSYEVRLTVHDWADHMPDSVKKHLDRKGLKVFVSGQRRTTADNGGLPLPLPLPKPVPTATPATGSGFDTSTEPTFAGRTIPEWVDHLYGRHPKKKNRVLVESVLIQIAEKWEPRAKRAGIKTRDELFQLIERSHVAECLTVDWTKERGQFAPTLDKWLEDEGYTANAARASPTAEPPPETDAERRIREEKQRLDLVRRGVIKGRPGEEVSL